MRICVSAYFLKKSQPQGHEIRSHLAREVEGQCGGVVEGRYGGDPFKLHAWGSNRMIVQPSSSPQWSRRILLNQPFISQLSKHVSLFLSRVLLVSNLRRSNWKCTVKRFFKSTVMDGNMVCEGVATSSAACITLAVKQGMDAKVFSSFGSRLWGLSVALLLLNLHSTYASTKKEPMKPSVPSPVRAAI